VPADDPSTYDNHIGHLILSVAVVNDYAIEPHGTAKLAIPSGVLKSGALRAFTSGVVSVLRKGVIPRYDPKAGAFGEGVHWCMHEWLVERGIKDKRHTYSKQISVAKLFTKSEVPTTGTFFIKFITKVMPLVKSTVIKFDCEDISSWLRDRDSLLQHGASISAKLEMPPCMTTSEILHAKTLGRDELIALNALLDSPRDQTFLTDFWTTYSRLRKAYDAAISPVSSIIAARSKIVFDKKNLPKAKTVKKGFTLSDVYEQMPHAEAAALLCVPYIRYDMDSDVKLDNRQNHIQNLHARLIAGKAFIEVAREICSIISPWWESETLDYDRRQARLAQRDRDAMV